MKNKFFLILIPLLFGYKVWPQGCIAIRNLAGFGSLPNWGIVKTDKNGCWISRTGFLKRIHLLWAPGISHLPIRMTVLI